MNRIEFTVMYLHLFLYVVSDIESNDEDDVFTDSMTSYATASDSPDIKVPFCLIKPWNDIKVRI